MQLSLWRLPPRLLPASTLGRKVVQLARQVCLSSNRTQDDGREGVFNPFLQSAGRCLQGRRLACLSASDPRGYRAGSHPLPTCSELTFPLPPQLEVHVGRNGGDSSTHTCPNPPSQDIKAKDRTFPGAGLYLLAAGFPSLSKGPEDSAFPTPEDPACPEPLFHILPAKCLGAHYEIWLLATPKLLAALTPPLLPETLSLPVVCSRYNRNPRMI